MTTLFLESVVVQFILEELAKRVSTTSQGLAALLAVGMIVAGFAFGGWARRRYLMDLRILRETVELEQLTNVSHEDLGLSTASVLMSARRWRNWAYERSGFLRFAFGALLGGAVVTGLLVGTASIGLLLAGAILGGLVIMAGIIVLAAVIFVLVSDLGETADDQDDSTQPESLGSEFR